MRRTRVLCSATGRTAVSVKYTPGVEESVFDKQALDQGSSYIKDARGPSARRPARPPRSDLGGLPSRAERGAQRVLRAARPSGVVGDAHRLLPDAPVRDRRPRRRCGDGGSRSTPSSRSSPRSRITVVLGFPVTRYRASFDAVTPVLAAVALDALWRHWRRTRPAGADAAPEPLDTRPAYEPAEVAG